MGIFAGLDIGTSGIKTILMDDAQNVLASATAPLSVQRPHPGWSEQDPDTWWQALCATFDALKASHPAELAALSGIGLSGHMHGATLLGADDRPLRPCILWNDGRSAAECAVLEGRADFRGLGGNVVMPGFTAPKLEWVRRHEPAIFAATCKVLLPKDYVRLHLTGEHVGEMSDSAGTLWLDVARRTWSPALLDATGLTEAHMPRLVEGAASSGRLRAELCARWGIRGPVDVAGGGGDNAASAAGVGAVAPGTGFLSLGTSGVLFVSTASFAPNTDHAVHAFCHAVPQTWHQMGVILSATDSLNWLGGITGTAPDKLAALAEAAPADHGLTFLPYLSGERTPHNDAAARGAFIGLSVGTGTDALARAVMEGVAFAIADCKASLEAAGTEVGPVYAIGGGARSAFWLHLIADIAGLTLLLPAKGDFGAAFGAARLAMTACGADVDAVMTAPPVTGTIIPSADGPDRYAAAAARFRALYPAVKALT